MNKTTPKDFEYFQKQCKIWQDRLSLNDWKIWYVHEQVDGSYAWIRRDVTGRIATIGLSIDWVDVKPIKIMLHNCARHELLHLLLADMRYCGETRTTSDEDFETAEHSLIRRLENAWND